MSTANPRVLPGFALSLGTIGMVWVSLISVPPGVNHTRVIQGNSCGPSGLGPDRSTFARGCDSHPGASES